MNRNAITVSLNRRQLLMSSAVAGFAAACGASQRAARRAQPTLPTEHTPSSRPTHRNSPPPTPAGPAREVGHGPRGSSQVALTFHVAGDPAVATAVLDAAHRAGAGLTMLVVGQWLAANPRMAARITGGGHDIGNHTWSHPVLTADDPAQTRAEVTRCRDLLLRLTGSRGRWFRPSGTPHATPLMLAVAGHAGYPTSLSYDVDPLDYTNPGADAVVSRVLADAQGGSIISLHTLYPGTAEALPRIISGLRSRGLEPVTTSRLLGRVSG